MANSQRMEVCLSTGMRNGNGKGINSFATYLRDHIYAGCPKKSNAILYQFVPKFFILGPSDQNAGKVFSHLNSKLWSDLFQSEPVQSTSLSFPTSKSLVLNFIWLTISAMEKTTIRPSCFSKPGMNGLKSFLSFSSCFNRAR